MHFHLSIPFAVLIALLGSWFTACSSDLASDPERTVHTVRGPVDAAELGFTLTHEHLFSNFGKDIDSTDVYDEAALLAQVVPYLQSLHERGVTSVVDCTTQHFGRRVDLLRTLADSTGINIITNTGVYGAANDRYVPAYCYDLPVEDIAQRWITEYEQGIAGSGIRPGFIKLAFDDGDPSTIDRKLFTAGILTHRATGLTLAVHTGNNVVAANRQMEMLAEHRVGLDAWIWTHANKVPDVEVLLRAATRGAWISLDGVKKNNVPEYLSRLERFREAGLLNRVLLSHDGNGFPGGGAIRPFAALVTDLIPALQQGGFTPTEIELLTVRNPLSAFGLTE
ncbi:MAG: phosphotriesterase [Bacteroidota bacterium]